MQTNTQFQGWQRANQGEQNKSTWNNDTVSYELCFETLFTTLFFKRYPNMWQWTNFTQDEFEQLKNTAINLTPIVMEGREQVSRLYRDFFSRESQPSRSRVA